MNTWFSNNNWNKNHRVPGSIKPIGDNFPSLSINSSSDSKPKVNTQKAKSFDEFQKRTDDAWDFNDDELISLGLNKVRSRDVVESTAAQVLNNNRKLSLKSTPTSKSSRTSPELPRPTSREKERNEREATKLKKFEVVLSKNNISLDTLRELCWNGIPSSLRPTAWRLLTGYLPNNRERQEETLKRKRKEYFAFVERYFNNENHDFDEGIFHQIHIDMPRTNPLVAMFQKEVVQKLFERVLYIWAIRHPASGYVQGINDLVTPFFIVFLSEFIAIGGRYVDDYDLSTLTEDQMKIIEADSFWCLSKLLDGIQDNYTFAQPGIQKKVNSLKDLIKRLDTELYNHLEEHSVQFLQFAFRWMNNLLMRELPLSCTIRLWDTYQSETDGFSTFHVYVCVAFLRHYSKELLEERDFQGLMLKLQNLPTYHWGDAEVNQLLAQAFELKSMFANAPRHFSQTV